jgi:hypothetical protein
VSDWTGIASKRAVTVAEALRFSVHVPVPLQAPPHPRKREPALAAALSVTWLRSAKLRVQFPVQLSWALPRVKVTVPVPDPSAR